VISQMEERIPPEHGSKPISQSTTFTLALSTLGVVYGDGIITPAISVLSAVEGLHVAAEAARPMVLPLTCIILVALFLVQHRGTSAIGKIFSPVMMCWFITIALLGVQPIIRYPHILLAINPLYVYEFFAANRIHGMVVLASVVLCITGGEALYADLGHFDRRSIRLSWVFMVFPALLLNYFGQGAILMVRPDLAVNPFYGLVPRLFLYPMVALSTAATIIASQAMISGVFSLTQQAVQLDYLPRFRIIHTSGEARGQIYIAGVNWALMFACLGLVLAFQESSRLAGAYGVAVTATMTATSIIYFFVVVKTWDWPPWTAVLLVTAFLAFDLAYFTANLLKFVDGAWITLSIAAALVVIMTTWKKGRTILSRKTAGTRLPIEHFLEEVAKQQPPRVPGTGVFMTISPIGTPSALVHHFKHNQVLHDQVLLLTIRTSDIPKVSADDRLHLENLGQGFYRIQALYGFMETPDVPKIMRHLNQLDIKTDPATTTYYLGRETLLTTGRSQMGHWRKALFALISRNIQTPTVYFRLPPDRVVELGVEIEF
jgi:KUP system potassium uptake protein